MKEKVLMIVFVLVLGTVLTAALVSVEAFTSPYVERNKMYKLHAGILKALSIDCEPDAVETVYASSITEKKIGDKTFYFTGDGNVAFEVNGSGLWGPIRGAVALRPDHRTIKGIIILHQEETPGLGSRIAEPVFLDRFKDKKFAPQVRVQPPGKASGDSEVDGFTGATLSCKAFEQVLNSEVAKYIPMLTEGTTNGQ
ncbi:MAG TPA: FMN-binding protein [Anaerohalosphaeraceae bacterium]|jgi:Na+-transporting NADH:ubiquinone oxidoreductase subunit C|nr:FMN-binding protein [Anaerohalosphaeraceae bacterium]HRT49341.1 FMN-binding protein [Anaerohalosphaeraceae bacterium]HRT85930.1 FMN-binding protein [Anaerohalosphaeraceae bacterium]